MARTMGIRKSVEKEWERMREVKTMREEDECLQEILEKYEKNKLRGIMSLFYKKSYRECVARFHELLNVNQLSDYFEIRNTNWSVEEDEKLFFANDMHNKWDVIARYVERRRKTVAQCMEKFEYLFAQDKIDPKNSLESDQLDQILVQQGRTQAFNDHLDYIKYGIR